MADNWKWFQKNFRDKTTANKGFAASVAGRKNNQQFCKAQLQSGQDKQLSTSILTSTK